MDRGGLNKAIMLRRLAIILTQSGGMMETSTKEDDMSNNPISRKVEVTLCSQDGKQITTRRVWSDRIADYMTADWQELFWYIVRIEYKEW